METYIILKRKFMQIEFLIHIEYLRQKTSTLTPQIVDEIRKAGGLGFKDKNVYTKAGAWGKTAFIGSNLETLPLYKNNWDLDINGHLKSYDPYIEKESGYKGWLPPKDDKPEAYTDLGIANPNFGCYGMGRNNFLVWEAINGNKLEPAEGKKEEGGFVSIKSPHGTKIKYKKITNGPQAGLWVPSGLGGRIPSDEDAYGNRAVYKRWLRDILKILMEVQLELLEEQHNMLQRGITVKIQIGLKKLLE